jgi:membrane-bound lytic murein transglycosylase D
MRNKLILLLLILTFTLEAQVPQVPTHMELGNMKLRITPAGQKVIQKHVDEIHKNSTYFDRMVDKARVYFPIIEKILREEGVPDDFKFLCIQESGFRADAVSTSNAVGYWQFKDFTAREVGLFVENEADERKHIIYATQGAAKYLKKNYFYLKNWVYTCQSYQMGLGGTQRSVDKSLFGAEKMTISDKTYWYVQKFLAHKVAYEAALKKSKPSSLNLHAHVATSGERFSDIARKYSVDENELKEYNKWLNRNRIPSLRDNYVVLVPSNGRIPDGGDIASIETVTIELEKSNPEEINRIARRQTINPSMRIILKINGKKAILANDGDSPVTLALRGNITKDRLMHYNDMHPGEDIRPDMVYYLQAKNRKSRISRHITKEGESLWEISQRYGLRQKSLMRKNRMSLGEETKPGRVLWLRKRRPKDVDIEYIITENQEKVEKDTIQEENTSIPVQPKEVEEEEDVIENVDSAKIELEKIPETDESPETELESELDIQEETSAENEIETEETRIEEVEMKESLTMTHEVSAGETLYSISKKYNCKVEELVKWNDLKSLSLSIGQKLLIRNTNPENE